MKLISWSLSDVGRKRAGNEDSYLERPTCGLFAVADGMGGHSGGERASRIAVEVMDREVAGAEATAASSAAERLRNAARAAGAAIYDASQADAAFSGMGTTLTALLIQQGRAHIAHVGDSRCYRLRDGKCSLLTYDHSWVSEQVRAGLLSEEDARTSRFKHVITRSVGFEREVEVDTRSLVLEAGDCFLLCSDGLSNYLEAEEMARLLNSRFYRDVPSLLVELANERGGEDNITVVLVYAANDAVASRG